LSDLLDISSLLFGDYTTAADIEKWAIARIFSPENKERAVKRANKRTRKTNAGSVMQLRAMGHILRQTRKAVRDIKSFLSNMELEFEHVPSAPVAWYGYGDTVEGVCRNSLVVAKFIDNGIKCGTCVTYSDFLKKFEGDSTVRWTPVPDTP
jgi:hypothetical protein